MDGFFAPPTMITGLLGEQEAERLRKQSIGTGLVGALIGGLTAAPLYRTQGLAPILGQALSAGMQGSQNVYSNALEGYMTQQKIAEMQRQQKERQVREEAIASLSPEEQAIARIDPNTLGNLMVARAKPKERKTATVGNVLVDVETGQPIFTAERDRKTATVGNRVVDVATGETVYEGPKARTTKEVDVGNKILLVDAETGATIRELPKAAAPKAPTELSYTTEYDASGNLFYVPTKPGSPVLDAQGKPTKDFVPAKAGQAQQAQAARKESLAKTSNIVIGKVDSALKKIGGFTAGWGGLLANVPGTKARSLQADIDTIKANLGFAELAQMREQSPTGGALGQVAVRELDFLQSTVANLDQLQDPQSLRNSLNEIKASYKRWANAAQGATSQEPQSGRQVVDFGSLR
jgi:hypothetical protein